MHQLIVNTFLFSASIALHCEIEETKIHLQNLYARYKDGSLNMLELSPQVKKCLVFYITNYQALTLNNPQPNIKIC